MIRALKPGLLGNLFVTLVVVAVFGALIVFAVRARASGERSAIVREIAALSPDGTPPESLEDLAKAVALYEDLLTEQMRTATRAGMYWKILASRYVAKAMYGDALDALDGAIDHNPTDPALFYMRGLSAANMAKSGTDARENEALFELAELSYKRALELSPDYSRALYGLSVLYVFELGRSGEAIPLLGRYLERQTRDTDALFLLARAWYLEGETSRALEIYDRIISVTQKDAVREEAERIRRAIQEAQ